MTDLSAEHTPGASDPVAVVRRLLPGSPRLSFHQRFDAGLWMAAGLTAGGAATVVWVVQRTRRR
ncbi:MAG: hypothetical protein HOQ45_08765 [Nocardioidaceae bacterium]|nr:hypothetical protein [Nocardioidaceae bacterium]